MRNLLFVLLVMIIHNHSSAQNYVWAIGTGGNSWDLARGIATDSAGNVFIAGHFESTSIMMADILLTNVDPPPTYTHDIFTGKFDANGYILWANSYGGSSDDVAFAAASDTLGNFFIAGGFSSDSITFGNITLRNEGKPGLTSNAFVTKFDADGNPLWAQSSGGDGWGGSANCISTDDSGNVIIAGRFRSDSIKFGKMTLIRTGFIDLFLAKFDSDGNILWAKSVGNGAEIFIQKIKTDHSGNIILSGDFYGHRLCFGNDTLLNNGDWDTFLAKYDPEGNVIWAKSAGSFNYDCSQGLALDVSGNILITGYNWAPITFDTIVLDRNSEMFIVKYNPSGEVLWAKASVSNNGGNTGECVTTDSQGNVYVSGRFSSNYLWFGNLNCLNNNGSLSFYIVKYNTSGDALWAKAAGGGESDLGMDMCMDPSDNLLISGYFFSPQLVFGNTTLTNNGASDAFLVKMGMSAGVEDIPALDPISFYPNPVHEILTINMQNSTGKAKLTLFSMNGQEILSKQIDKVTTQLDLSSLPAGIYLAKMITRDAIEVRKILKE